LRVPLHFALAVLVLGFALPTEASLAVGAPVVVVGLAVRAWAAGHLRRDLPLTTSGPYAYVRHPLYLGSALVLAGFALAAGRWWLGAVVALYFLLVFLPVLGREERERETAAAADYAAYRSQVPALIPYRGRYAARAAGRFRGQVWLANREWRGELGCAALFALLYTKMLWG
jgi:protein-S-isoprenylcysteine O-methyltransferase Ste14